MNSKEIAQALIELAEKIAPVAEPEVVEAGEITDEMISMNIFGVPDMHIRAGEKWFAKVRHLYDPKRDVWHKKPAQLLFEMMYDKDGDPRRWKPEEVEGLTVRRSNQQIGAKWDRIKNGYVWDYEGNWYKRVSAEDGVTTAEAKQYFRDFPWKDGVSLGYGCPPEYLEAWNS
jgi:hypothetical protein